jgi:glycerophosphoryl diester phosphodiesterase
VAYDAGAFWSCPPPGVPAVVLTVTLGRASSRRAWTRAREHDDGARSREDNMTRISAHRGGFDYGLVGVNGRPLDEFGRYERAITIGAEFIELDVRRTRDGRFICFHDETIDGLGAVCDLDFAAIVAHSESEPVIPIERLFAMAAGRVICHVDLKSVGHEVELVDIALDILGPSGFVVTTTELSSIAAIRAARPQVRAVLTLGKSMKGLGLAAMARRRRDEIIPARLVRECGARGLAMHWAFASPPLLRYARRMNLLVMVWTVNPTWQLRHFLGRNDVDVVVTDRPFMATRVRAGLTRLSGHLGSLPAGARELGPELGDSAWSGDPVTP